MPGPRLILESAIQNEWNQLSQLLQNLQLPEVCRADFRRLALYSAPEGYNPCRHPSRTCTKFVEAANPLYRQYQHRIGRSVIPMISAACHHVIFFAIARKITSWIFITRSTAATG
jgi:hypothetical protein